jgi:hypothetical protein
MPRGRSTEDVSMLEMALVGFQMEKQRIESKIQEIQSRLKGKRAATPSSDGASSKPRARRELSVGARRRIAAAQKRRWAEHRKRAAQAARTAKAGAAS